MLFSASSKALIRAEGIVQAGGREGGQTTKVLQLRKALGGKKALEGRGTST